MRLHRFIHPVDLSLRRLSIQDGAFLNQVKRVLRLRPEDELLLSDGKGKEARARIVELTPHSLEIEVLEVFEKQNEPSRYAVLYLSILKRENFELVVQKATEVGISEIIPVLTSRTVKTGLKIDRLRAIAKEAAEQSGRAIVPQIHNPISFASAVEAAADNQQNFFFEPNAKETAKLKKDVERVGIFIGPEGGWNPEEVALVARVPHIEFATLGPLTLRAETAAIIATYLMTQKDQ